MNSVVHRPVLLKEVIELLSPREGETLVDFTVGTGGHFIALAHLLGNTGFAIGIDRDEKALAVCKQRIGRNLDCRFQLVNARWSELENVFKRLKLSSFDVGLMDLGLSSYQLADKERGFSFMTDAPLDMQMGRDKKTAFEVVNSLSEKELERVIKTYGEERLARRISKEIVARRTKDLIRTTLQLVEAIDSAIPGKMKRQRNKILARTFQSLRIFVNDEVEELKNGLTTAVRYLSIGGRLGVISYHSIEDRIVKRAFQFYSPKGEALEPWVLVDKTRKPITPTREEIKENVRARSAKLRVVIKTEEGGYACGN